jgi:hypothetical protein
MLLLISLVYLIASLGHFVHNAEFLDQYPNLPGWITRKGVYLGWLIVTLPGLAAMFAWARGRAGLAFGLLALWGALAYLGLDHYYVAPASAHPSFANVSIVFEVIAGSVLLLGSLVCLVRLLRVRRFRVGA